KNVNNVYTQEQVLEILKSKEGYLFPETYNYAPWVTLEDILKKIDAEFLKRTATYNLNADDLKRILTIASILEKEVPHPEDMKIVSGIIQNRLSKNMPLQMDSTLGYFTGKASLELTTGDLQLDSPYNTYKVKGLPSGPIGNPGDVAIDAAINPNINEYIFFLSDSQGVNHYAKTYAEHLRNRKLYLNK
ncbi:endolytic transglycosylase MltG, partial [Candidatus Parcubacteria bacterium]|nr:endolytic transglycosylase MltG [Candidatus Parcubacteria bacterium]